MQPSLSGDSETRALSSAATCDTVACCFGCLSLIPGFRKRLVARAAFFPPDPPGYRIEHLDAAGVSLLEPQADRRRIPDVLALESAAESVVYLRQPHLKSNGRCSALFQRLPVADWSYTTGVIYIRHVVIPTRRRKIKLHAFVFFRDDAEYTVLFSHGNSTDIGLMYPAFLRLSRALKVNVVGYDFCGYGASNGAPSEQALYSNIQSVFDWLTNGPLKIPAKKVILYGQSVGSAPALYLAGRIKSVAGVIIHSGMMSAFAILRPTTHTLHWFDVFRNLETIKKVQAPILLIHGTADREIHISHAQVILSASPGSSSDCWAWYMTPFSVFVIIQALRAAAQSPTEFWRVKGAGHNDIEVLHTEEYFRRLQGFLSVIKQRAAVVAL